ncbi:hypothetical protein BHM03_00041732, partial [Ensete ventricosum]
QALRVAVPLPSADLQNSGASAAAAGIASGRPRCQVKICRIQARALLQQALRVAVPLPSQDVSHDRSCSLRSNVPVPSQSSSTHQMWPSQAQVQMSATSADFERSRHCDWPSRHQVQICRIQARALLQQAALRVAVPSPIADFSHERCCSGGMTGSAACS